MLSVSLCVKNTAARKVGLSPRIACSGDLVPSYFRLDLNADSAEDVALATNNPYHHNYAGRNQMHRKTRTAVPGLSARLSPVPRDFQCSTPTMETPMADTVIRISAVGTRGNAAGKTFEAKPDASGRFVLNRKKPSGSTTPTNLAVNKVFAASLTEAAELLATDDYLINLVASDGTRALRELKKVRIESVDV